VRNTTKRLEDLSANMVYPMHGSCIDKSLFSKYTEAIMIMAVHVISMVFLPMAFVEL
jgi:hypothetical protein